MGSRATRSASPAFETAGMVASDRFHSCSVDDVAVELGTDLTEGLSESEVVHRRAEVGSNALREGTSPSAWERMAAQLRSPLVLLLLAAMGISVVAWMIDGEHAVPVDAIAIGAIVSLNAVIGFTQERRADEAVAALRTMVPTLTTVIRGGRRQTIDVSEVVPGDIVQLAEGDMVCADGRVVEAHGLGAAEAVLTGESVPVAKQVDPVDQTSPLGDRTSMVFAMTSVVSGTGRIVVTATGMQTEAGRIAELLEGAEEPPTPLERELAVVGKTLLVAVVVVAIIVVAATWWISDVDSASDAVELLLIGVSLAVAAVPEGLPAVLSLVLAIGVRRMAARDAVLKRLTSAETLGSTTVICSDKTGTLTRNEMSVARIVTRSGTFRLSGIGYSSEGEITIESTTDHGLEQSSRELTAVLEAATLVNDADVAPLDGSWVALGDPTEAAIVTAAMRADIDVDELRRQSERDDVIPFDARRKFMATLHRTSDHAVVYVKGAPEAVIALCESHGDLINPEPLGEAERQHWIDVTHSFADRALRTLAVAGRHVDSLGRPVAEETHDLTLMGVIGMSDPPRAEVADAVRTARDAGIRVVMVTGDHPTTAARIARDIGIADGDDDGLVVTGADLDDQGVTRVGLDVPVLARVSPKNKLDLVEALQAQGHVVAMTGDGVNDAPALKAADIGVAMGIAGSDVSKGAADMILVDDNFATIVAAVEEGRSIFSNIAGFLRYLLSSNMGEVLTMFLGVALAGVIGLDAGDGVVAPLLATQILWINLLTDTAPALALGLEPVAPGLMKSAPRRIGDRLIDKEMIQTIAVLGFAMAVVTLAVEDIMLPGGLFEGGENIETARTAGFTVLVLAQLFNAFNSRSQYRSAFVDPFSNKWLWGAVGVGLVLQIAVVHVPIFHAAFGTTHLSLSQWLLSAALAGTILGVGELHKRVMRSRST